MKKYYQRKKLLKVCLLIIVLLSLAFGYGPILKFFEVLTECLSEFKWVHNIAYPINNDMKPINSIDDTFLRFGISQDSDDVKIFIWTSRNRVEYKTIQIGILI